jgi:hypothetical protein
VRPRKVRPDQADIDTPLIRIGVSFDGGTLTAHQLERIVLDPNEHTDWKVQSLAEWARARRSVSVSLCPAEGTERRSTFSRRRIPRDRALIRPAANPVFSTRSSTPSVGQIVRAVEGRAWTGQHGVMVTSPAVAWLQEVWPQYGWQDADVHEACFHDVAVWAPEVVGRVSCHGDQTERVQREHRVLELLGEVQLPYDLPRPLSGVVSRGGRTGMLTSFVAGEHRPGIGWDLAVTQIRNALTAFAQVTHGQLTGRLPEPRSWCGGRQWAELVHERLLPRLRPELQVLAISVVADVLEAEKAAGDPQFVHGDFGPHNILWRGDQIVGVLDLDHACLGDPAIDAASLISFYGAERVSQIVDRDVLDRAMIHRASLTLQLATAADLLGDAGLRDHALGNFRSRSQAGTLYDPGGRQPDKHSR